MKKSIITIAFALLPGCMNVIMPPEQTVRVASECLAFQWCEQQFQRQLHHPDPGDPIVVAADETNQLPACINWMHRMSMVTNATGTDTFYTNTAFPRTQFSALDTLRARCSATQTNESAKVASAQH